MVLWNISYEIRMLKILALLNIHLFSDVNHIVLFAEKQISDFDHRQSKQKKNVDLQRNSHDSSLYWNDFNAIELKHQQK